MNQRTKLIKDILSVIPEEKITLHGDFYFGRIRSGKTTTGLYRTILNVIERQLEGKTLVAIVSPTNQQFTDLMKLLIRIAKNNKLEYNQDKYKITIYVDKHELEFTFINGAEDGYKITHYDYTLIDNLPACKDWMRLISFFYSHTANIIVTGDSILDD